MFFEWLEGQRSVGPAADFGGRSTSTGWNPPLPSVGGGR